MLAKWFFKVGAAALFVATPVQAEEHTVILTGFSYFPTVLYADPGDTVRFVNASGSEQTIVAKNDHWVIGPLSADGEGTLVIEKETQLEFYAAHGNAPGSVDETASDGSTSVLDDGDDDKKDNYGGWVNASVKARITFNQAPLN